jgi:uncharacterized small protein (DUF1192 family)
MLEEPATPRVARGVSLIEATREDLDLYAVGDLEERIETLQGEILRTRSALDRKKSGRAEADALFSIGRG